MNSSDKTLQMATDKDYLTIENALGLDVPDEAVRHQLDRISDIAARNWEPDDTTVRQADFLRAVRQLKRDAEALLKDLSYPSYRGDNQQKQSQAIAYGRAIDWLADEDSLKKHLIQLVESAEITLDVEPPDKGGKSPDHAFEWLIGSLTNLYERTTGREAGVTYHGTYQGPFFHFVKECIERLAPTFSREDDALGKALQRYIQRRRKRSVMDKT